MKANEMFALILTKVFCVQPKFRKQGDVYKTYSIPQKFVFDPASKLITYFKPITVLEGGKYVKDVVLEMFKVEDDNNGQLTVAKM